MVTKAVCVRKNNLELIEEVKKLEDYYDEICVDYDVEEPKLILEVYDTVPCIGCELLKIRTEKGFWSSRVRRI